MQISQIHHKSATSQAHGNECSTTKSGLNSSGGGGRWAGFMQISQIHYESATGQARGSECSAVPPGERQRVATKQLTFNGFEVVHDGNPQAGDGVQHRQHHDIQGQGAKQRLQGPGADTGVIIVRTGDFRSTLYFVLGFKGGGCDPSC